MGKSQFFSDLNEIAPGFVRFFNSKDIGINSSLTSFTDPVIIFIDEVD